MILTFGQYNILMAARHCVTGTQLSEQTNFDASLVNYFVKGLVGNGLIKAKDQSSQTYYELTDSGMSSIEEYERANPDLIINRLTN